MSRFRSSRPSSIICSAAAFRACHRSADQISALSPTPTITVSLPIPACSRRLALNSTRPCLSQENSSAPEKKNRTMIKALADKKVFTQRIPQFGRNEETTLVVQRMPVFTQEHFLHPFPPLFTTFHHYTDYFPILQYFY